jgi:FkbM family methyltransferase
MDKPQMGMPANSTGDFRILHDLATPSVPSVDPRRPVWVFGVGSFGRSLAKALRNAGVAVAGFVQSSPDQPTIDGLPVFDWLTLRQHQSDAQLVMGIFNREMAQDQLTAVVTGHGFDAPVLPQHVFDLVMPDMGWRYWLSPQLFLVSHLPRIAAVAARLADGESRATLYRVTAFRLGLDASFAGFRSSDPQYVNALTRPFLRSRGADLVYVDGGAYNGDSYRDLRQALGTPCRQALLLEPDPSNYAALVRSVSEDPAAICLPNALSDQNRMLPFGSGQGEASALDADGTSQAAAVALDALLPHGRADFIKLDVEGAELAALQGARRLIMRERPMLAFSLYHHPQDLWVLPELLFEWGDLYDLYVRQHHFNSFDLVCYAVPRAA